ncbi:MlaD family protein [Tsukamurella paurometabola]|uniref:Virulence factor Mce family protein n=1 Tax=Tsukamurella paurometabola (strain ATCC 8368 / DSM 20162 / CCUG 35730 / CIP 100753 / JCM 10117 / KCTC 9821 / NBRC 16120 / NCIMB 702349 / NCTC 13040) TaxID=521096 RepID=D5UW67_TSUPD|nr:MlaD family protein [Tsukamurella paurometabola]ADG77874.1 virulence factor Mce family protein [Tsukamurella paurometabola DSM 20162]SUP29154.1 virulence factor Mce family protein [Tsukamurella paurometabola]
MKSIKSTAIKIAIFAALMILILVLTMQALTRPPAGKLDTFHADFKDVSGLKVGDDVRMLGVQVGKVTDVAVQQSSDHRLSNASVSFTVQRDRKFRADDTLAIRYQNLTGSRFLEVQTNAKSTAPIVQAGTTIDEKQTQPSFDITTVFVGLKPVLSTLNADDINHLSQSVLAVINGNGEGLGPLLGSLDKLMSVTNDRQRVLTQLITNLGSISQTIGGASPGLTKVISELELFARTLASNVDSMREWSDTTSGVVSSTNALLAALGLTPNQNPPLDAIVANAMPLAEQAVNALATLPGIVQLLNEGTRPQADAGVSLKCSNGTAKLPGMMNLFVAGQKVTVCNAK